MSFVEKVDASIESSYKSNGNLYDTPLNTGGVDVFVSGTVLTFTFTNVDNIFGGGGFGVGASGSNAVQIEKDVTVENFINLGNLCGGGGAGGTGNYISKGGAGGGGGGSTATQYPGGDGGNGLQIAGNPGYQSSGGGGGFGADGGPNAYDGPNPYGLGSLAGGGGGSGGNAGSYGSSISGLAEGSGFGVGGGGGAGGGRAAQGAPSGGSAAGGGGGGGSGGGIPSWNVDSCGGSGGYGIYNIGKITTLENQQGIGLGLGALFYAGNLPTNYNIIIQSDDSFGQLFYTGSANVSSIRYNTPSIPIPGTLDKFDISTSSSESLNGPYDAVLVNIIPTINSGTYRGGNWYLQIVPAGTTNCKGNIVTIGGIEYDSYDLIFGSKPISYTLSLISLVPNRGEQGQTIKVNFETSIPGLSQTDPATIIFGTSSVTGSIDFINYDTTTGVGTGFASGIIPIGSGTSSVSLIINKVSSTNSLDFTYVTFVTYSEQLTFTGKNGITDSNGNLFVFSDISFNIGTPITDFTVTVNNDLSYNSVFSFIATDPTDKTTLKSVQLQVTNNSNTYNLIYDPYLKDDSQTLVYWKNSGSPIPVPTYYGDFYIDGTNPWYFTSTPPTTPPDESNTITYNSTDNFISASSTTSSNSVNENIGTLGMVGAASAFESGITPTTNDTYYASVAWCFFSLYKVTGEFK